MIGTLRAIGLLALIAMVVNVSDAQASQRGTLFLAHGSMNGCGIENPSEWEKYVIETVDSIRTKTNENIEVAFGMWNSGCFQKGVDSLNAASPTGKIDELRVIPILISSHSTVVEMQKYIFKKRSTKPFDNPRVVPIQFDGEIDYQKSIDYSPFISMILANRAHELVHEAKEKGFGHDKQDLILVMHGPSGDEDNSAWLQMGQSYIEDVNYLFPFQNLTVVSLRDDAKSDETREKAAEQLRKAVDDATSAGRVALILPLLVSKGGIESGILERLGEREYIWTGKTLLPDPIFEKYLLNRL